VRCILIPAVALAIAAQADTLYLKSGKEYTGTFVSGNKTWIHFTTDARVPQTFHTRDVDRIEFGLTNKSVTPRAAKPREEPAATPSPPGSPRPVTPAAAPAPPPAVVTVPTFPLNTPRNGFDTSGPADAGAIDAAYTGAGNSLGPPLTVERWAPDHRAVVRYYRNGDIYWTAKGGAHAILGPVRAAWLENGGPASRLGYPVGDEQDDSGGDVRTQSFEHGSITWDVYDGASIQYNDGAQ
jgi:hypothetical protein